MGEHGVAGICGAEKVKGGRSLYVFSRFTWWGIMYESRPHVSDDNGRLATDCSCFCALYLVACQSTRSAPVLDVEEH